METIYNQILERSVYVLSLFYINKLHTPANSSNYQIVNNQASAPNSPTTTPLS